MIRALIAILWLVFGVMTACSLFYTRHRDHQLLGVTLSKTHAQHAEVQSAIAAFAKTCYLILFASIACSFMLHLPAIARYAESFMLLLVVCNFFAHWFVLGVHQKKLKHIKEQNNWRYRREGLVTVNLAVSREKGKFRISSIWVWLFLALSFVPVAYWLCNPAIRQAIPLVTCFVGPLCQLCTIFLYYHMHTRHASIVHAQPEHALAYMQREEQINSICATLCSFVMLLFWIAFSFSMLYTQSLFTFFVPLLFLIVALLAIAYWQQNRIRALEKQLFGALLEDEEAIQEQPSVWRWGCYYNPGDPRLFVPKRIYGMGWTINAGRPLGKAIYFGMIALVLATVLFMAYGGTKEYRFQVQDTQLLIDAAMYDRAFAREQIVSLTMVEQLPKGVRTNGYGGANKSFGHFSFETYGSCMLYIYNPVNRYIVIELTGTSPAYVIINDQTTGATEALYQTITQWWSE